MTSTIASPSLNNNNDQNKDCNQDQMNEKLVYVPHSPYYELVHHCNSMEMSKRIYA